MFKAIKEFFGFYDKPATPVDTTPVAAEPVKPATEAPKKATSRAATPKPRSAAVAKGTKGRKKK